MGIWAGGHTQCNTADTKYISVFLKDITTSRVTPHSAKTVDVSYHRLGGAIRKAAFTRRLTRIYPLRLASPGGLETHVACDQQPADHCGSQDPPQPPRRDARPRRHRSPPRRHSRPPSPTSHPQRRGCSSTAPHARHRHIVLTPTPDANSPPPRTSAAAPKRTTPPTTRKAAAAPPARHRRQNRRRGTTR
ncbi:unnamed protein product [Arctogadus glacialis]